jgi:hypothetical protein
MAVSGMPTAEIPKAARITWTPQSDGRQQREDAMLGDHSVGFVSKLEGGWYVTFHGESTFPAKLRDRTDTPKKTVESAKRTAQEILNAYVKFLITGEIN